jgi:hypothetical protein
MQQCNVIFYGRLKKKIFFPDVRFPGLYANKYAFIVKYAFIAKYAIICIIRMMLFYLESSEMPRKL